MTAQAYIVVAAVIAGLLLMAYLRSKKRWRDISIPMPSVLRDDLHYCYYLSLPGQMAATADHTSLLWHGQFYGLDQLASELSGHPHGMVLDCAPQLFRREGGKSHVSDDAAVHLRLLFSQLRDRGLLHRVKYLVPMDEPNLFCDSEHDLKWAMDALKSVVAEFHELSGVRYMCIYGDRKQSWWCLGEFDVVGVDAYDQKSEVLTRGAHADLMRSLLPHQQAMVIPGAAYGQDPSPFVAYAHGEPRCWGIVPFIWAHVPESADKEGWTGLSRRSAEDQERYRAAGLATLQPQPAQAGFTSGRGD